jgi:hypothetical protein
MIFEPLPFIKLSAILIGATIVFKILEKPNAGKLSVNVMHISLTYEDKRLKLHRV